MQMGGWRKPKELNHHNKLKLVQIPEMDSIFSIQCFFSTELFLLPSIPRRRWIEELARIAGPPKDPPEGEVQSSKAEVQVHLRAKERQGGREPLHLGVLGGGQRERAYLHRVPAPLSGLRVRGRRLRSHRQPGRSHRVPLPRPARSERWKSCSKTFRLLPAWKTSSRNVQRLDKWCWRQEITEMIRKSKNLPFFPCEDEEMWLWHNWLPVRYKKTLE